ncbi:MAG: hypothetical protein IE909_11600 [Campylobacterales bacterium]|nr:hypothetical protein [Campylobacterales bacterium]
MALTVDKDGKIVEKHLSIDEETIKNLISKTDRTKHEQVLQRAIKTKINRRIVS